MSGKKFLTPIRLTLLYALAAITWVIGTDLLVHGSLRAAGWSPVKGGAFVAVTAFLLYVLTREMLRREAADNRQKEAAMVEVNARLRREQSVNAVLIRANRVASRAQSEQEISREIVAALVEHAGIRLTYIGWVNEQTLALDITEAAGPARAYTEQLRITVDPTDPRANGPTGRAIRLHQLEICTDFETDPRVASWRGMARENGIRSSVSVPVYAGTRRGTITAYAAEPDFFDDKVQSLLQQLALDLAAGIERIDLRLSQARATEALAEAHATSEAVMEHSPVGIIIAQPDGQLLRANPHAAKLLGHSIPEVLKLNFRTSAAWQKHNLVEVADRVLASGSVERAELDFEGEGGRLTSLSALLARIHVHDDPRLVVVFVDITAELATQRRMRLLEAAIEATPTGVVIANPLGETEWVNPGFTRMTGYSLAEVAGRKMSLLKSGRQSDAFYETLWGAISRGKIWSGELQNQRKDGTIYWEHMIIAPVLSPTRGIQHYVAIKQDISERKGLEQQFARAQRLESIGLLAGGIAHDLNNVLAPIMMAMDIFKLRYHGPGDEERFEMVRKSAERGAGIVRQVLTFARGVDGEKGSLRPEHIVKEVRNLVRETLPRNIDIQIELGPDLPAVVGDMTQLHQVMLNLCVNARDAMRGGGLLTIGAKLENIEEARVTNAGLPVIPGPHVMFYVRDTGTGIPPEVLEHLFEPFFTTKARGEGTGLGLSTVFGLVRGHRGGIDVKTELGRGSEFRVYLPAEVEARAPKAGAAARANVAGAGHTVLLVDDEDYVRTVTTMVLKIFGFTVVEAVDGEVAIRIFREDPKRFDAVLLDLVMPRAGGDAVAKVIKELRPDLPIILTSGVLSEGRSGNEAEQTYRRLGDLVLQKPFSQADLVAALLKVRPDFATTAPLPPPGNL